MKRCTICHATYPANFTHCPHDGSLLTDANEWLEGGIIRGKYRILEKVGQGGMATVYKAVHIGFDEVCALKAISLELASDPSFVKRFAQEAALSRKLQHPNAVRVEDIDQADDGRPFIVMEFIEGESLKQVIDRHAPLPVARVCQIAKQIAAALDAAHELGIVHRDIKPANIILTKSAGGGGEVAKVLDFGIAKIKEAHAAAGGTTLTRTGMSVGTPSYMSPEQAMGRTGDALDGRADLYSLGVVMYEMLSGELPMQAESQVQMLMAQINTTPEPLRARRPELPEGIAAVVMQCLEKDPARRPSSAAELIQQIENCERGIAAGPPSDEIRTMLTRSPVPEAAPKPASARLRAAIAWVAAFCVLAAMAGWYRESRHKSVAAPATVASRPPTQAAPATNPATPNELPPAPPLPAPAGNAVAPPQSGSPAGDLQSILENTPMDEATKAKVRDILRQANELAKKGDTKGAAAQFRKLTGLGADWVGSLAALGTALAAKSIEQAANDERMAGGWDPAQHGHHDHGAFHHDLKAAIEQYAAAVRLQPNSASPHQSLGAALGRLGDLNGDMREQQKALRIDPNLAAAHAELGSVYARKEAWSDAAREYREALRLQPDLAEAHSGLGETLANAGDWDGDIAEQHRAIQQAPALAVAHFRLAAALEHEDESPDALEEYRRAAELEPGNPAFRSNYQRLANAARQE